MKPQPGSNCRSWLRRPTSLAVLVVVSMVSASAGASTVDPSLEITGSTSGICDNSGGTLNPQIPTLLTYSSLSSDEAEMSIAGVGVVATGQEDLPFFPVVEDSGTYGLLPSVYSVPAGTEVTVTITTYNDSGLTGGVSYVSTIVFDCDTGEIISLVSGTPEEVPTLGFPAIVLLAALLALIGAVRLALRARRLRPGDA
jgi:hypothetical protein